MAVSRRTFLAAAGAAFVAACSKASGRKSSASSAPPASTAPTGPPTSAPGAPPGGPAQVIYSGPRDSNEVALTFHGSGDLALTQQLLDEAAVLKVPITVFAVGTWLKAHPDMAKRILAGGNELENHTLTHPQLRGMGASVVEREIVGCRDVLTAETGSGGRFFRPSGMEGDYPPVVMQQAGLAGYSTVCGFDVDPRDYQDPGAAAIEERVRQAVRSGSIVSLHTGHAGTVKAFPNVVADIRTRGLQLVLVRDLLA